MSFRRQLKATFKELFGGGSKDSSSTTPEENSGTRSKRGKRKGNVNDSASSLNSPVGGGSGWGRGSSSTVNINAGIGKGIGAVISTTSRIAGVAGAGAGMGVGGITAPGPAGTGINPVVGVQGGVGKDSEKGGLYGGDGNWGGDKKPGGSKQSHTGDFSPKAELPVGKERYAEGDQPKISYFPPPQYSEHPIPPPPPPPPIAPSSPAEDPWNKALSLLTTQERLDLFHSSSPSSPHPPDEQAIISSLLNDTQALMITAEDKSWSFKNPLTGTRVNLKSKLNSFLSRISTYIRLGDIAIQHSPEVTALVWSGIRLVLTLLTTDAETWGVLVETMEGVAGVMGRCRIYERMYCRGRCNTEGARRVQESLIALYASLLTFSVKAKRYFAKSNSKRIMTAGVQPFEVAFGPVVMNMRKCEARVELEARAAAEEAAAEDRGTMMDLLGAMGGVEIPELKGLAKETGQMVQKIRKAQEEEERLEVVQWLSKVKFGDNHKAVAKLREKGTGEWLFERAEWKGVFAGGVEAEADNWWDQPLEIEEKIQGVDESTSVEVKQAEAGLWLYGLPGTGKTVLTSLVIDHLTKKASSSATSHLAYFYCSYTETPRRQARSFLATILKQLVISLGNKLDLPSYNNNLRLPQSLIDVYRTHKQQGFSTEHLDLSELEEILFKDVLEKVEGGEISIVIDALDEMEEKERKELFPVLQKLVGFGSTGEEGVCKVKIFIASRGGQRDVKLALGKDGWKRMGLEKSDTGGDIRKYVESQTDAVIQGGELLEGDVDDDLQKKIVESLVKGAEGMFLWVRYQIANLCEQETEEDIHLALKNLPSGIEETYTALLERIDAQSLSRKRLAYRVLQWMLCSTRPLTPRELVEAVAIDPVTDKDAINPKRMMKGVEAIVDICGNFISYDEQLGVLRFVHFTVQEFLEKKLVGGENGGNANEGVVQVCLALLCFRQGWKVLGKDVGSFGVVDSNSSLLLQLKGDANAETTGNRKEESKEEVPGEEQGQIYADKPELALAEYAILNWGHHGKLALEYKPPAGRESTTEKEEGKTMEQSITHDALDTFLSPSSPHFENWIKAFTKLSSAFKIHIQDRRVETIVPNQLFTCVYFQIPNSFTLSFFSRHPGLIETSYTNGWTHYHLAAALAAHHVINPFYKILSPIMHINTTDSDGRTPLHTIASSQRGGRGGSFLSLYHEEALTTKALLQHGCNPGIKETRTGNSPIHNACEVGNLSCLRAFLVYCSPLPLTIPDPQTPIPEGIPPIPKFQDSLLLERQLNVWGYTPIHTVLFSRQLQPRSKCELIMHLLALGGHDINARDSFRMTPIERILKDISLPHELQTLVQFLYDCGGVWDVKKPGLKKVDVKEWGRGAMPVMLMNAPMVASYRVAAAIMPGRTQAQMGNLVMQNQLGGKGRVDRGFVERCLRWCESGAR